MRKTCPSLWPLLTFPRSLAKIGLGFNDIVEEIPVQIHNSLYANALLHEIEDTKGVSGLDFERLDLSSNPFLERNLDNLIECMLMQLCLQLLLTVFADIEDLVAEQNKYQYWQRTVQRQEAQKAAYAKKKVC
jgi:translation initiation factor 3 subunit H